ncbi:hypothetical protein PGT21_025341 [Puccinia graminis f. sp. tritici]|uniref:Uncharacterized protein n=1 Tax=Puccinia graminis f. sp. tritici TaxID=56615 RepID=A0A5B0QJ67_PUCGR|nr:hypothetical protein PGT21_025341 [Puccinia graminis f. sp. tritici]KAA1131779.1 hypothetical protein PGTUg99_024991 [Puccinia graminis f. sp. tritici]
MLKGITAGCPPEHKKPRPPLSLATHSPSPISHSAAYIHSFHNSPALRNLKMRSSTVLTYLVTLSVAIGLCVCVDPDPNVGFVHSWRSPRDREATHMFSDNEVTTEVEVNRNDDGTWSICANNRLAFPVNFQLNVDGKRIVGPRVGDCRTPNMILQHTPYPVVITKTDKKPKHVSFTFYLRQSSAITVKQMDRMPSFSNRQYTLRSPRDSDDEFGPPFVKVEH